MRFTSYWLDTAPKGSPAALRWPGTVRDVQPGGEHLARLRVPPHPRTLRSPVVPALRRRLLQAQGPCELAPQDHRPTNSRSRPLTAIDRRVVGTQARNRAVLLRGRAGQKRRADGGEVKSDTHRALPAELTSFVGRRQQLAEIRRLLSSSRLLTLTGVGGAGKTRLALRTAVEMRRAFSDGVWFVELAALRDPELLPHTIAGALDLHHVSGNPLADLADHLEDKQLLVVLDNCEQLTEACAVVVSKLLAEAPGLRVLATSRQLLDVEGEQALAVPPLSIPGDAAVLAGEASRYESVALLVDRARAVDPHFQITEENQRAVIELCRRLDGLPLALELAAVWLRALAPEQILDRLEDRFQLLTTGRRGDRPDIRRWTQPSVGASTCALPRSSSCGRACQSSRAVSTWTQPRRSAPAMASPARTCSSCWPGW
jgi:hypothetical protein